VVYGGRLRGFMVRHPGLMADAAVALCFVINQPAA
jgi:hypothetical protein